jgi:hypothetical protein
MISRLRYEQGQLRNLRPEFYSCERLCSRKATLHEHQVEPAAELVAHLMKMAYVDEAQAFMQLDGYGVVRVD